MKPKTFEEIDHLINLDPGNRGVRDLYEAARKDEPLCLKATKTMKETLGDRTIVGITTGFPIIPPGKPETDGPSGAVMLGKAAKELGSTPLFMIGEISRKPMEVLTETCGLENAEIRVIPTDGDEAEEFRDEILTEYDPSLLISVEKPGESKDGRYYNMTGEEISREVGKIDPLFVEAPERGIPTIGIGDGGNEIGMGNVHSTVEESVPHGEKIAAETEVESLVTGGVSNWGSYGVLVALSGITERQLVHDADLEVEMVETCVESGAVDGVSGESECSVDGIPCEFHVSMVRMLRYLSSGGT